MNAPITTLAQLSDVHLGPLPPLGLRHWRLKRAMGRANWRRGRERMYLPETVAALVADLREQAVDHTLVSGDLVNIGLPQEHAAAAMWLRSLGPPDQVSVVPGNHDIYVRMLVDRGVERWRAWMRSDAYGAAIADAADAFPYVKRIGDVAIVGLNSAVPMPPGIAAGRIGSGQLDRLAGVLDRLAATGLFRLVMVHHPPLAALAPAWRGLKDAARLEAVLMAHGAELVVHGHNHTNTLHWLRSQACDIPVVGLSTASLGVHHHHEPLARYNIYRISRRNGGWQVDVAARGLAEPGGPVVALERHVLGVEAAARRAALHEHSSTHT